MNQKYSWLDCEFDICLQDGLWRATSGLYIFAAPTKDHQSTGSWLALYVGQTSDFSTRIPNHERWQEALQLGATHVHARDETASVVLDKMEEGLIQIYQPPMNVQHG